VSNTCRKNNMNTQKLLTQAAIKAMIYENEDGPSSSKLSHMSLGMKLSRVVISEDDVAKYHEKIIKLGQEIDPQFNAKFFEKTGKIVGSMSTAKIHLLNSKLKDRAIKAIAEDTPQKLKKKETT
jgi:hypothetical protein